MKGKALILLIFFLSSCVYQVKHEEPTACRASCGMAVYENEAYSWISAVDGPVYLNDAWIVNGVLSDQSLTAENSDVASLSIGGDAWIRKTIVRGNSSIGKQARVFNSHFLGNLSVGKELDAFCTIFEGEVCVNGYLGANYSQFNDALSARTGLITLKGTQTQSIYVYHHGPYFDQQVILIEEGSVVDGDITFESQRGRVILDKTSKVTGNIIGGHVIECFEGDK